MRNLTSIVAVLAAGTLTFAGGAWAERDPFPHEFKQNNMGYCAPYLAQLTLPDGTHVPRSSITPSRPRRRGTPRSRARKALGDFYNDKAQSTTDTQCLARR